MNRKSVPYFFLLLVLMLKIEIVTAQQDTTLITIDANKNDGPFVYLWSYFGYDEANYTTMKDGRKLLSELSHLSINPVYVRVHNLLTTGDGKADLKWSSTNVYTEDKTGNPLYNWTIVDSIFDVFIQRGIKPIAEIGFMPEALSVKPEPYRHHWKPGVPYDSNYTGWAYPPKDYKKWVDLIFNWVNHCIKKYGKKEVESWYWEVWNEPNISYWKGTMEEYLKLYDYTVDAVKRACPNARVGGPTSTGPRWDKAANFLSVFLQHCIDGENYATGKKGAPLDYVTFHAKGDPKVVDGSVQMNMSVQLKDVVKGFEIVNSFPSLKKLPIMIGEFDPEGCAACSVKFSPQNAYRNGTMYSSYTAASFAQLFALRKKYNINLIGAVSWSFEFENQAWFGGFRDLATNGIDKPVLNVFRMFGMMKGNMLSVNNSDSNLIHKVVDSSVRHKPYVDALATTDDSFIYIMLWNYHDDENNHANAFIKLLLKNIKGSRTTFSQYTIDENNSNSYSLWMKMGSPQNVSASQFAELEKEGHLKMTTTAKPLHVENGAANLSLLLKPQVVTLLKIKK